MTHACMVIVGPYHALAVLVDNPEGRPQKGANKDSSKKCLDWKAHFDGFDVEC